MEGFQYVVEYVKPNPICFGSKLHRDTDPLGKGLSSFQRRYVSDINPNITPQTYDTSRITSGLARLQNKVRSNKGVGGLANGQSRFPHKGRSYIPSPTRYDFYKAPVKKNKYGFGSKVKRETGGVTTNIPGAGTYNVLPKRCTRTKTMYNFGRPRMVPAVEEVCSPVNTDKCHRCGAICKNDYWHKNHDLYLCHMCMEEEKVCREDFTMDEMKKYQKIRTCSHRHDHEGTSAAYWFLPKTKLQKRDRLENYLNLYISSF